jgi:hypothetical protein
MNFCLFLIMPVTIEQISNCSVVLSYGHSPKALSSTNKNFHLRVCFRFCHGTRTAYKQTTSSHINIQMARFQILFAQLILIIKIRRMLIFFRENFLKHISVAFNIYDIFLCLSKINNSTL